MSFYYIVVNIDKQMYFIDKDLDLTDNFDFARRFQTKDEADEFISKHYPNGNANVMFYKGAH